MQEQRGVPLARWWHQQPRWPSGRGSAQGDAALGLLDCVGRLDAAALGPVPPRAARRCDVAPGGQMLACPHVGTAVAALVPTVPDPALALPGRDRTGVAVRVLGLHPPAARTPFARLSGGERA